MHEYPFYKYMFEPQLAAKNPTLAFIGYLRTIGPHLPPVELQARYATLVFAVRTRCLEADACDASSCTCLV